MNAALAEGKYPIVNLGGHFSLVYGQENEDWLVADPNKTASEKIATSSSISKINIFSPSNTDLSYIMLVGQVGTNFEIDGAMLDTETIVSEDGTASTSAVVAYIPKPSNPQYQLRVTGSGTWSSYLYDRDGNVTKNTWTIPSTGQELYQIDFDPSPAGTRKLSVYDVDAPDVSLSSSIPDLVRGTIQIVGSVVDDHPHHYWFVIEKASGGKVAGPGVVNDNNSFRDKVLLDWDTTKVADGDYVIKLEARDAFNNKDSGSVAWKTIRVDNTAPSPVSNLHFDDPSNVCGGYTNQKYITIDWDDATDNTAIKGYDYAVNYPKIGGGRGDWTTFLLSSSYRGSLNEGLHIIKIRSVDTALNKSEWSPECTITYDSITPTLTGMTDWGDGWYRQPQKSYFYYSDENLGSDYAPLSCTIDTEGIAQGCSVSPNVCDLAGNCNTEIVHSDRIKLDMTAPTLSIDLWGNTLAGTASDALSGVERVEVVWRKDGNNEVVATAFGTSNWRYYFPSPSVGKYEVKVFAYDNAGNKSSAYLISFAINPSDPPVAQGGEVAGATTALTSTPVQTNPPLISKPKLTLTSSLANESTDGEVLGEKTEQKEATTSITTPTPAPSLEVGEQTKPKQTSFWQWRSLLLLVLLPLFWLLFRLKKK